jgi:hypothetical protein
MRGDGSEIAKLAEIAAETDREAVLAAAEALRRDEASLDHMMDLHTAVLRFRGPYALALEREVNSYLRLAGDEHSSEGLNEHMGRCWEELRKLFRADIEAVIEEASGK